MVQLEVAERLAAAPGLKHLRRAQRQGRLVCRRAPRGARCPAASSGRCPTSTPAWSRWSAGRRRTPTATREEVFACIDAAFAQRRKTLRAALAGWAGRRRPPRSCCVAAGVDPRTRGEQLDVAAFAAIAAAQAAPTARSHCTSAIGWAHDLSLRRRAGSVTVRVPAKVNLELLVGPRRDDGFHALSTIFQPSASRRGHRGRRPTTGGSTVTRPATPTGCPPTAPTSPCAPPGCSPRRPASTSRCTSRSTRTSRSPAAWPAARPTPPPPWSRCDHLWGLGLRPRRARGASPPSSAATSRSCSPAAPRWARGRGERARAGARPGQLPLGLRPQRERPVDPRGVCRVRPAARRPPASPTRSPSPEMMTALRSRRRRAPSAPP